MPMPDANENYESHGENIFNISRRLAKWNFAGAGWSYL